jgi:hypothetical protein
MCADRSRCYLQLQNVKTILQSAIAGYLPSGVKMKASTVAEDIISSTWGSAQKGLSSLSIPEGITKYEVKGAGKGNPLVPNDRVMWQLGTWGNAKPLVLLLDEVNGLKGSLFSFAVDKATGKFTGKLKRSLIAERRFNDLLLEVLNAGGAGIAEAFLPIRNVSFPSAHCA